MAKHRVIRGEKSTLGQANGSPQSDPDYVPKHGAAGSDLPARGAGVIGRNVKDDMKK